jgi:hypothetical protein
VTVPRKRRLSTRAAAPLTATCPDCDKLRYPSRRAAKQAAAKAYQDQRMRAYPCGAFWHLTSGSATAAAWHRERAHGQ